MSGAGSLAPHPTCSMPCHDDARIVLSGASQLTSPSCCPKLEALTRSVVSRRPWRSLRPVSAAALAAEEMLASIFGATSLVHLSLVVSQVSFIVTEALVAASAIFGCITWYASFILVPAPPAASATVVPALDATFRIFKAARTKRDREGA